MGGLEDDGDPPRLSLGEALGGSRLDGLGLTAGDVEAPAAQVLGLLRGQRGGDDHDREPGADDPPPAAGQEPRQIDDERAQRISSCAGATTLWLASQFPVQAVCKPLSEVTVTCITAPSQL